VSTHSKSFIPLCVPQIQGNEWRYVKDCLDTAWVSSVGSYVNRFEESIAEFVGVKHAIATVNGTSALHTALLVAGVQSDDEVIVSTLTFIAPVNAIRYIGAHPVLIDSLSNSWQIDVQRVRDFLEQDCIRDDNQIINKITGRRVKAILPVHILGHPVEIDSLQQLANEFNLSLIEDATESLGASYEGKNIGTFGNMACLSFNGNKLITTGGGGMILTDNDDQAKYARYLTTQAKDDVVEYIHNEVGYNYRLTNVLAAIGLAQAEQLESYVEKKKYIAKRYDESLRENPHVTLITQTKNITPIFWLYTIYINSSSPLDSRQLLRALADEQIQTRPLWQPIHLSPAYPDVTILGGSIAEDLYAHCLSIPCSIGLTNDEQTRVIDTIQQLISYH
jgi:perosamine synthetase